MTVIQFPISTRIIIIQAVDQQQQIKIRTDDVAVITGIAESFESERVKIRKVGEVQFVPFTEIQAVTYESWEEID